jgi:predicted Zn-dependent protease
MISDLEKLLGTPRDGALLRFSLGVQYAKAGERERAIGYLRDSVAKDPLYSAAWKALGKALADAGRNDEALEAYRHGVEAAKRKGDKQAEKEMTVFARRLERQRGG